MVRVLGKSNAIVTANLEKTKSDIIDTDKAKRAAEALQMDQTNSNFAGLENYQPIPSNKCQSETDMSCDSDGDSLSSCSNGHTHSITEERHAEVIQRRKERRRERNKLSAQAYRQRKREEIQNQDKVVIDLEKKQKSLQEKVAQLEQEKMCVEKFLRNCFHSVPWPVPPVNNNNQEVNNNNNFIEWKHNEQYCNQPMTTATKTFGTCSSDNQGQNRMTLNKEMVVS